MTCYASTKTWVQIFSKHVNRRLWPEQLWPQHCGKQKQPLWGLMVTNHLYIQWENLFQKNTERDGTGHPIPSSDPTHKHTLTYACMHLSPANQQSPQILIHQDPPASPQAVTAASLTILHHTGHVSHQRASVLTVPSAWNNRASVHTSFKFSLKRHAL